MELISSQLILAASEYVPVAILVAIAVGLALFILVASALVGPRRIGPRKHATYESGMEPIGDTRRRFGVKFYLVAVLFLIFDVELIFLYPWAVLFPRVSAAADGAPGPTVEAMLDAGYSTGFMLAAMGVFFALLLVGFWYEWRRGVFKWN